MSVIINGKKKKVKYKKYDTVYQYLPTVESLHVDLFLMVYTFFNPICGITLRMDTCITSTSDTTLINPTSRNAINHATNLHRQGLKLPVLSIDF